MSTPYLIEELDETLSDLDLYNEARQYEDFLNILYKELIEQEYEIVKEALGLLDFKWDDPLLTD